MQHKDSYIYSMNNIPYNLLIQLIQTVTMGNLISSKQSNSKGHLMTHSKSVNVSHCKMFYQNSKTQEMLMREMKKLRKKVSLVPYSWAQNLNHYLTLTPPQQLYQDYQHVLNENLRRDDNNQIIFHALKLRETFLIETAKKYKTEDSILSITQLKELVYQTKSYFMVMIWLHGIASLDRVRASTDDQDTHPYIVFTHEEKIYSFVVEAIAKTYVQYLQKEEDKSPFFEEYQLSPQFQNCEVFTHLKHMQKIKHFHERQEEIVYLQELLRRDQSKLDKYLFWIKKMFGRGKVFAYLLLIQEIGHFDISYLWKKIYGGLDKDIFH